MGIRIRLGFDAALGGGRRWMLVNQAEVHTVSDLCQAILQQIQLAQHELPGIASSDASTSKKTGPPLLLAVEGFELPHQEEISIVRDGDLVRVGLWGHQSLTATPSKPEVLQSKRKHGKDIESDEAAAISVARKRSKKETSRDKSNKRKSKTQDNSTREQTASTSSASASKDTKKMKKAAKHSKGAVVLGATSTPTTPTAELRQASLQQCQTSPKRLVQQNQHEKSTKLVDPRSQVATSRNSLPEQEQHHQQEAARKPNTGHVGPPSTSSTSSSSSSDSSSSSSSSDKSSSDEEEHENESVALTLSGSKSHAEDATSHDEVKSRRRRGRRRRGRGKRRRKSTLIEAAREEPQPSSKRATSTGQPGQVAPEAGEIRSDPAPEQPPQQRPQIHPRQPKAPKQQQQRQQQEQHVDQGRGDSNHQSERKATPSKNQPSTVSDFDASRTFSQATSHPQQDDSIPRPLFESWQQLKGSPRVGDHIAFQVLEISLTYTPMLSDFKDGVVLSVDHGIDEITVALSRYSQQAELPLGEGSERAIGKFNLLDQASQPSLGSEDSSTPADESQRRKTAMLEQRKAELAQPQVYTLSELTDLRLCPPST